MTKKKPTPRPRKTPHPRQASDAITIVAPATTLGPDRTAASAKPAQTRGSPKNTNVNAPLSVYTSWKFRMMNTPMTTSAPNNGHSMAPNFCFPMLQTSAADTMWTMASESSEGPPSERGNTGARQVVTRRSNRKLLILIWVIFVGSSVVLAWAWFTQTEGALPLLGYMWAGLGAPSYRRNQHHASTSIAMTMSTSRSWNGTVASGSPRKRLSSVPARPGRLLAGARIPGDLAPRPLLGHRPCRLTDSQTQVLAQS